MSSEYQNLPPATRQAVMSAAEAIAPEQSAQDVRESLSVTDKGKTANTIDNCRIVFCCDPLLRDAIRLNLLTDRVDIVRDLGWRRNTSALTDTDVKYLLLYFEQNYELTSEKKITAALSIVANENCYHPIQDVLNSLVWDGTPRIRSCLHHFLGADESDYVEEMLKHFLLGAIRRVFRPGSKYEEMLCLVGGQGAGKSTFFRLLAIRDEWFSDDLKSWTMTGCSRSCKATGSSRCRKCLPPAAQRALKKFAPLSADRRKPTERLMNPSPKTGCGSVCSAVLPTHWTSCRWIGPGTGAFSQS